MTAARSISSLGRVMQHGFVPHDIDRALNYWISTIGAGPFFHLPHVDYLEARYRGTPSSPDFSLYLGHWQDLQIELIEQHDDAPSVYRARRDGLHHVGIVVADLPAAIEACIARGAKLEQENIIGGGGAAYLDTGDAAGTLIELIQTAPMLDDLFAMIRRTAMEWDGRDPIRSLDGISFT